MQQVSYCNSTVRLCHGLVLPGQKKMLWQIKMAILQAVEGEDCCMDSDIVQGALV